jgi:DNA polymerase-3 subunit epsilon
MLIAAFTVMGERANFDDFKLDTVARHFGIDVQDSALHDAMYDVIVTRDLYYKILASGET